MEKRQEPSRGRVGEVLDRFGAVVPSRRAMTQVAVLLIPVVIMAAAAFLVSGTLASTALLLVFVTVVTAAVSLPTWPDFVLVGAAGVAACVGGLLIEGHMAWTVAGVSVAALAQYFTNRRTAGAAAMLPVVVFMFAGVPHTGKPVLAVALWGAVGAVLPVLMVKAAKAHVPAKPVEPVIALRHSLLLAASCAVLTWLTLRFHVFHGLWLIITMCMVFVPIPGQSGRKSLDRLIGTCTGGALTAVLLLVLPARLALLLALPCGVFSAAWSLQGRYRNYVFWTTPAVLLGAGAGSSALGIHLVLDRVVMTLAATLLAGTLASAFLSLPAESDE